MRKATLEDLLARAEQAKKDRMRTVNVSYDCETALECRF